MERRLLTEDEVRAIVKTCPANMWYKRDCKLVAKSYCAVAADAILQFIGDDDKLPDIFEDKDCAYNRGERTAMRNTLKNIVGDKDLMNDYIENADVRKTYEGQNKRFRSTREDRMCHCFFAQGTVDGFEVVDYQVPTSNGGHDKIDLILQKDNASYVTETKWFGSKETLLRCVLEIQTYYQKLNNCFFNTYSCNKKKLRKAVLVSEDSLAYKQLSEVWAKKLLRRFDIVTLKLSRYDRQFHIETI